VVTGAGRSSSGSSQSSPQLEPAGSDHGRVFRTKASAAISHHGQARGRRAYDLDAIGAAGRVDTSLQITRRDPSPTSTSIALSPTRSSMNECGQSSRTPFQGSNAETCTRSRVDGGMPSPLRASCLSRALWRCRNSPSTVSATARPAFLAAPHENPISASPVGHCVGVVCAKDPLRIQAPDRSGLRTASACPSLQKTVLAPITRGAVNASQS